MAGELVAQAACAGGGELVPVDSEHSAVLQCVTGRDPGLARLILTCSGGPFREWPAERVAQATVEEALRHPTWRMGSKITVDCATLANKALELIEAHHLFGLPYDALEVVVHPQSIVHAFTEFCDGSVIAQLGFPSMELPILYALDPPRAAARQRGAPVRSGGRGPAHVRAGADRRLPRAGRGLAAGRAGGISPAVFNAANEVAVSAFLEGAIPFGRISEIIEGVLDDHRPGSRHRARGRARGRPLGARARPRSTYVVPEVIVLTTVSSSDRGARRARVRARGRPFRRRQVGRASTCTASPSASARRSSGSPPGGARPSTRSPGCRSAAT